MVSAPSQKSGCGEFIKFKTRKVEMALTTSKSPCAIRITLTIIES